MLSCGHNGGPTSPTTEIAAGTGLPSPKSSGAHPSRRPPSSIRPAGKSNWIGFRGNWWSRKATLSGLRRADRTSATPGELSPGSSQTAQPGN
jgi:hypothetical protein